MTDQIGIVGDEQVWADPARRAVPLQGFFLCKMGSVVYLLPEKPQSRVARQWRAVESREFSMVDDSTNNEVDDCQD